MNSKLALRIPTMISVKTKDTEDSHANTARVGVDLICVVDHSGSMMGEKIDLVRKTLVALLDFLSIDDRLCII